MTKVFVHSHNSVKFIVREEQRNSLNEALEAKGLSKCESQVDG